MASSSLASAAGASPSFISSAPFSSLGGVSSSFLGAGFFWRKFEAHVLVRSSSNRSSMASPVSTGSSDWASLPWASWRSRSQVSKLSHAVRTLTTSSSFNQSAFSLTKAR
eukprot:389914_1